MTGHPVADDRRRPSRSSSTVGWVLVGILGIVVLVLMVVLAAMATLIWAPLAAVPVLLVLATTGFIVWDVRRQVRSRGR